MIAQPTPPPGSEVKPRDVNYQYGDPDPERVTALINVGSGTPFASYAYDEAGNQTVRCYGSSPTSACTGESTEYLYDGQDQLRRATKKLAGVVQGSEEYWYGSDGQRIAIVKRDAAGAKTEMIWFIGDTQAHYDPTGAITRIYSHLSLGTPIGRVERTSNTSAPVEFQFHGLASNTLAAVAYDGTVNASFSYAPFGEVVEAIGGTGGSGTAAHCRRFNDKQHDEFTALGYYGVRYYDTILNQWTQSDPLYRLAPESAWNDPRRSLLYSFTKQNPLRYLDPDGRDLQAHIDWMSAQLDEERSEADARLEDYRRMAAGDRAVESVANPFVRMDWVAEAVMGLVGEIIGDDSESDSSMMGGLPASRGAVNGNSRSSNKTQHSYDIVRKPGGQDAAGPVKTGISGRALNQDGSSGRANSQVNALNRSEKGKNQYEAVVTKKNVTPTKKKTSRERILDYEKNRSGKHIKDGEPMDKHQRPRPKDDKPKKE